MSTTEGAVTVARTPISRRVLLAGLAAVSVLLLYIIRAVYTRYAGGDAKHSKSSGKRHSSSGSTSSRRKSGSSSKRKKTDSSIPTLIVLVGLHGSGKSAWAKQYVERVHKSYIVVSSDVIRSKLTGTISNYTKEDEVEAEMLKEIGNTLSINRSCIVDDCVHSLSADFRAKLLQLAPEGKYNRVLRLFPIKPIFARSRIDKDIAEGKVRYVPTAAELEDEMHKYTQTEENVKAEGWILDD